MKLENAQKIVSSLERIGVEASLYENYSGRGMFGTATTGIVVGSAGSVETTMKMLGIEDSCRTDSMGLDVIVY